MERNGPDANPSPGPRPALVLYQPDIAHNTGTLARASACFGTELHIIEPAGFDVSDRNFRRAGMDYIERASIKRHDSWDAFLQVAAIERSSAPAGGDRRGRILREFRFRQRGPDPARQGIRRRAGNCPGRLRCGGRSRRWPDAFAQRGACRRDPAGGRVATDRDAAAASLRAPDQWGQERNRPQGIVSPAWLGQGGGMSDTSSSAPEAPAFDPSQVEATKIQRPCLVRGLAGAHLRRLRADRGRVPGVPSHRRPGRGPVRAHARGSAPTMTARPAVAGPWP